LARLASSYAKCAGCPHRSETGALAIRAAVATPPAGRAHGLKELVRTDFGYRGVYVNRLNRNEAIAWSAAFASLLWDNDAPLATLCRSGASSLDEAVSRRRSRPTVVIGYDERPASPDILTGVALGLKRMSCQVIDVGLTTSPCLAFAVHHLEADAGLHVTGAGCEPGWTGFDARLRHGLPPDVGFLDRWQAVCGEPISRPSRSSGSLRAFPAAVPYEANLWKHFHALRPLRVVCGSSSAQLLARLERLFGRLPGRLHAVELPVRRRLLDDPRDADVERIGAAVREQEAHFGLVIDDDAMTCGLVDEQGRLVPPARFHALVVQQVLREHGPGQVLLSTGVDEELLATAAARGGRVVRVADDDLAVRLSFDNGSLAVGRNGRIWFGGDVPSCDALLTLAVLMQALSRSDAEASQVLGMSCGTP
jgi:phosphomannomutase